MERPPPEPVDTNSTKRQRLVAGDGRSDALEQFQFEQAMRKSTGNDEIPEPVDTNNLKGYGDMDAVERFDFKQAMPIIEHAFDSIMLDVAGFLAPSDHANLALTKKTFHKAFDFVSKQKLLQLKTNHAVDETFAARIRDRVVPLVPLEIPSRIEHHAATMTHLYTLVGTETFTSSGPRRSARLVRHFTRLALNSSGTRLAILDQNQTVCIWDLKKKQCIGTSGIIQLEGRAVYYFDDHVVVCSRFAVLVFTETGVLLRQSQLDRPTPESFSSAKHGQTLLLTRSDGGIYSFNVHDGTTLDIVRPQRFDDRFDRIRRVQIVGVHDNRWLLVDVSAAKAGLHVYDLANQGAEKYFLEGEFRGMIQCDDCTSSFHGLGTKYKRRGRSECIVHTFEFSKQGKITRKRRSFPLLDPAATGNCPPPPEQFQMPTLLASFRSLVCSTSPLKGRNRLQICCANKNGIVYCRRSLVLPDHHELACSVDESNAGLMGGNGVSNGKELFVPLLDTQNGNRVVVAAYAADEYF